MSLLDIFYNEFNRWRDKKASKKEIEDGIKFAISKTLTKLDFLWKDMILTDAYSTDEKLFFLSNTSEELLNMAVEVKEYVEDSTIQKLREISVDLKKLSRVPKVMTVSKTIEEEGNKIMLKIKDLSKEE